MEKQLNKRTKLIKHFLFDVDIGLVFKLFIAENSCFVRKNKVHWPSNYFSIISNLKSWNRTEEVENPKVNIIITKDYVISTRKRSFLSSLLQKLGKRNIAFQYLSFIVVINFIKTLWGKRKKFESNEKSSVLYSY